MATSSSCLLVRTTPVITDPAEMKTILHFSLRGLWGDLETFSTDIVVRDCRVHAGKERGLLIVECPSKTVDQVRAALTFVSPPPYMDDTVFQFDVVDVEENTTDA